MNMHHVARIMIQFCAAEVEKKATITILVFYCYQKKKIPQSLVT